MPPANRPHMHFLLAAVLSVAPFFSGYHGCFVLLNMRTHERSEFNTTQCARRFPPQSTFKIFNTMDGVDVGFLHGPDTMQRWSGEHYAIAAWNQDQTLQSAVAYSVVWYFQRVATAVGPARMQHFINAAGYGNRDISGGITHFWLDSSLRISANEEADFVARLYENRLPFSSRAMHIVRQVIVVRKGRNYMFSGKTGTGGTYSHATIGWFVGHLQSPRGEYAFAANIFPAGKEPTGPRARAIVIEILESRGLLPR